MRVFSTLMSWSNESKSCMRVEKRQLVESFYNSFFNSLVLVKREEKLYESRRNFIIIELLEFVREFSQLSCPSQTTTRVA